MGRPANAPRHGWCGDALHVARVKMKLRQSDLAYLMGVSQKCISMWEAGGAPTTSDAERLSLLLHVTTSRLGKAPWTKGDLALLSVKAVS